MSCFGLHAHSTQSVSSIRILGWLVAALLTAGCVDQKASESRVPAVTHLVMVFSAVLLLPVLFRRQVEDTP